MRMLATTLLSFSLIVCGTAAAEQKIVEGANPMSKSEDLRAVAPALENYARKYVLGDLWKRPGLSARDRGIVTAAALIARDQTVELPFYLGLALDHGVKPAEISNGLTREEAGEVLGHLAFYAGWPNAFSAAPVVKEVIEKRPR